MSDSLTRSLKITYLERSLTASSASYTIDGRESLKPQKHIAVNNKPLESRPVSEGTSHRPTANACGRPVDSNHELDRQRGGVSVPGVWAT